MASRVSTNPSGDFPQNTATFSGGVNAFMEADVASRVTFVLRTPFDLSNNLDDGRTLSYGDFTNSVESCSTGGCRLFVNDGDAFTSFASRFRGYLNVTPEMVGKTLHFGFYADDAVSLTIYDRNQFAYQIINRPPQLGFPSWRTSNTVTFNKSGLYPVEILYTQIGEHAALELSVLAGTFADFERPANQPPVISLETTGFTLVTPDWFYQTETGQPSFPDDLNACKQCNRQFANAPGNGDCGQNSGYYCNGAALCAPCDTATKCGPSCSPCGLSTPNCVNVNGTFTCTECINDDQCKGVCDLNTYSCTGECKSDSDCPTGRCDLTDNMCRGCSKDGDCPNGQVCDVPTATCVQCTLDKHCPGSQVCATELHECRDCNTDSDCPRGQSCSDHACTPCNTDDSCAGSSCNCCPDNTRCASPTPGAPPSCVECTNDNHCPIGRKCDPANGRCVAEIAECNTSDRCGPACVRCPTERPLCLDGQVCVQCRNDLECGDGQFCLSGECASCTDDKHCGPRCGACDSDAPFCLSDGTAAGSVCVQCRSNDDCPGGTCDLSTHTCQNSGACAQSCTEGLVCNGSSCVECFADAHCPCGGTCDTASGTCTSSCNDSTDCLGVEHCSASTQECERGRRKPGTEPQGGAFCCGTPADLTPPATIAALALLTVAVLLRPRRSR